MPTVPVYIRKEDWNKWITIEKKSEFIHNALNGDPKTIMFEGKMLSEKELTAKVNKEEPQIFSRVKDYGGKLCKHGSPKGSCMHKEATRLKCNV